MGLSENVGIPTWMVYNGKSSPLIANPTGNGQSSIAKLNCRHICIYILYYIISYYIILYYILYCIIYVIVNPGQVSAEINLRSPCGLFA